MTQFGHRQAELTDDQIEAIVAEAITAEASSARGEAAPPAAAVVWWRAQRRARQEAAQLADKPIAVVHALAIACGAGLALTLAGIVMTAVRGSLGWLSDVYRGTTAVVGSLAMMDSGASVLTVSLTAALVTIVIVSLAAVVVFVDE
jgi:hypothetical protein